jgi:4a-hydroxytetrahydrobiopterin dehydratase
MSDLIPLAQAHCLPLKGSEHKLTQARVAELVVQVPGWELAEEGRAVCKTFRFDNYYQTMAFVNALAWVSHQQDHHPDLMVSYKLCAVSYCTHSAGGALSRNDFICAARASALAVQRAAP